MASPKPSKEYSSINIPQPIIYRVPTQVRGSGGGQNRVPSLVRGAEGRHQIYDPVLVSLGPYHYGLTQLRPVEDLKSEILDLLIPDKHQQQQLITDIQNHSNQIRTFYERLSIQNDVDLAEMMLRDACFLIYCLKQADEHHGNDDNCVVLRRLGMSKLAFVVRDFFMLENQLPYFTIKMLIPHTCERAAGKSIDAYFYELVSSMMNCEEKPPQGRKITHLLDCCRTLLVGDNKSGGAEIKGEKEKLKVVNSQFQSVMDLKAKGVHFRPTKSKSYRLTDIEFRSHSFYGMLRLPILLLESKTKVILSNIIAMEMSPGSGTDFAVTSYAKFMKSLIMKAEDVKELREKGILVMAWQADDEEVVRMFRELETEGACRRDIFRGVRERINDHCRSKTKTFKAELLYTYFRSPWTTIALLAAVVLLCINCLNFLLNYHRFALQLKRQ
ncbi:hypothetical protein SASPL_116512 [Salvia splendens]|uniref:Uncharacterized protein n=1 Tax=Salvia splendens TaxID=180675 RepID=A0A8X8ZWX5_SALSN|nr:UPF0481 protein At3g47200-like [Salvia splendens]KAG6419998.1 hypothetical protein SASPL_116512 [Salvia splendens]